MHRHPKRERAEVAPPLPARGAGEYRWRNPRPRAALLRPQAETPAADPANLQDFPADTCESDCEVLKTECRSTSASGAPHPSARSRGKDRKLASSPIAYRGRTRP